MRCVHVTVSKCLTESSGSLYPKKNLEIYQIKISVIRYTVLVRHWFVREAKKHLLKLAMSMYVK